VVLALDELEVEQQIRCAALFLTALFDAPREHWYPALVVVDEAQMFAPAVAGEISDDTRRLTLSAMTNLMCRGRKRGLAGIVATQRLAKLAKNVAAEASNFLMGRTFLDIDMARAADLLGMDRRQAERIRDLQRGQFLGLGPAISRRPVAVNVGAVRTAARGTAQGLMPLPETAEGAMAALLTERLAEAASAPATPRPAPPPRAAAQIEQALAAAPPAPPAEPFTEGRSRPAAKPAAMPAARPVPAAPGSDAGIAAVISELADEDGATFLPAAQLFREFAIRCRQRGIASAHIDIARFRRLFAAAVAGLDRLTPPDRSAAEALAACVDDDVLAPYLAMVVATMLGEPLPDEDALARIYGSSSPSRIRRLLDHMERSGLIVVREEFGGERRISVPAATPCPQPQD
jgi:hypothetical protein